MLFLIPMVISVISAIVLAVNMLTLGDFAISALFTTMVVSAIIAEALIWDRDTFRLDEE